MLYAFKGFSYQTNSPIHLALDAACSQLRYIYDTSMTRGDTLHDVKVGAKGWYERLFYVAFSEHLVMIYAIKATYIGCVPHPTVTKIVSFLV